MTVELVVSATYGEKLFDAFSFKHIAKIRILFETTKNITKILFLGFSL